MDEAPQAETKEKRSTGYPFHLASLLIIVLIAPPLVWLNCRAERRSFQNAEVNVYGWPLPMLYMEINSDSKKLDPPTQYNLVSFYYNLTIFVLILVCAGAFTERRMRRPEPAAVGEDATPAVH